MVGPSRAIPLWQEPRSGNSELFCQILGVHANSVHPSGEYAFVMRTHLLPGLAVAAALVMTGCSAGSAPVSQPPPAETSVAAAPTELPSPDAPTTAPPGSVTADDLPAADDLVWNDRASWTVGATTEGGGTEQLFVCQQNSLESLGANAIQVRTYTLSGADPAVAIAMSFDSRELADQAYETVKTWNDDCLEVLDAQGRNDAKQTITALGVPIEGGRGHVTEWAYPRGEDNGEFESQGLYQIDDRIGLLAMRIEGQDNSWDTAPGGPVGEVHPIIRSLPAAAAKLAR